jgi:hypothetical protein
VCPGLRTEDSFASAKVGHELGTDSHLSPWLTRTVHDAVPSIRKRKAELLMPVRVASVDIIMCAVIRF